MALLNVRPHKLSKVYSSHKLGLGICSSGHVGAWGRRIGWAEKCLSRTWADVAEVWDGDLKQSTLVCLQLTCVSHACMLYWSKASPVTLPSAEEMDTEGSSSLQTSHSNQVNESELSRGDSLKDEVLLRKTLDVTFQPLHSHTCMYMWMSSHVFPLSVKSPWLTPSHLSMI